MRAKRLGLSSYPHIETRSLHVSKLRRILRETCDMAEQDESDLRSHLRLPNALNPKELFKTQFSLSLATVEETKAFLVDALDVCEATVSSLLASLGLDDGFKVDENAFAALVLCICKKNMEEHELEFLKSLARSFCSRCETSLPINYFLSKDQTSVLLNCMICRKQSSDIINTRHLYSRVAFKGSNVMELMLAWHSLNVQAAATLACGYYCLYMSDSWMPRHVCSSSDSVMECIRRRFETIEMYEYVRQSSKETSVHFYCSQRFIKQRESIDALEKDCSGLSAMKEYSSNDGKITPSRRFKRSKKSQNCYGSLHIKHGETGFVHVRLSHKHVHEKCIKRYTLQCAEIDFIECKAQEGLSPFKIFGILRKKCKESISLYQVYYRWAMYMEKKCKRDPDPFISGKMYLESASNLSQCFFSCKPFALGFTTGISRMLTHTHECGEAFIDSTYKTNSSKLELFTIIVTIFGTGFPLAYLFLKNESRAEGELFASRQEQISRFLESVKLALPFFNPKFFFTDKDHGQMNAIRRIGVQPSLCLWHMKKSVKKKIQSLRKSGKDIDSVLEDKVLRTMTDHYNMHPYIVPIPSVQSIHSYAVDQMRSICESKNIQILFEYLWTHWYEHSKFLTWGRRSESHGIPLARTTMMVEAHWSLLKKHYLVLHNRPRVDFVIHLMDTQLIGKYESDYELRRTGRVLPTWFKQYTVEWKKLKETPLNNTYSTNLEMWTCSCPSFLGSRFMICKHLVQKSEWIEYRDLVRSRHPPFISSVRSENRHFALCEEPPQAKDGEADSENADRPKNISLAQTAASEQMCDLSLRAADDSSLQGMEDCEVQLKEELKWMQEHVQSLTECDAGSSQIRYIYRNVWKTVSEYRKNILQSHQARSQPQTWAHRDTLFLP